jgi:hypothetical protein
MKKFILIFIGISFWGCTKIGDTGGTGAGSYEHYRLINPNNLLSNCSGDLLLNYTTNDYSFQYKFNFINKKDTAKFYFSESGKFSDAYKVVASDQPFEGQSYYYSGKFSFTPQESLPWGCTYQLSDTAGFKFTFLTPTPHLITFLPVYDKKMITHVIDSVQAGVIKPWIEIVPIEDNKRDTMQLYWL